jgi:hypothetical protein
MVTIGGSNTDIGRGVSESPDAWPRRVERQLRFPVLNLGRQGLTLREAFNSGMVDRALSSGAPFIAVAFAVDDCLQLEVGEFSRLLGRLVREVQETDGLALLMTGVWLEHSPELTVEQCDNALMPFNEEIRAVAARRGARLIDVAAWMDAQADPGADKTFARDRVIAGSRLMGHLMVQAVRSEDAARLREARRPSRTPTH